MASMPFAIISSEAVLERWYNFMTRHYPEHKVESSKAKGTL